MLHLSNGIETADGEDLLFGSSVNGVPCIRQVSQMPAFHQSKGWKRAPVTTAWLEEAVSLAGGLRHAQRHGAPEPLGRGGAKLSRKSAR
jgi:hypothetical protein